MSIPVYGLSGLEGIDEINDIYNALGGCSLGAANVRPRYTGKSFNQFTQTIKNNAYKEALINRNNAEIGALNGCFDVAWRRVSTGHATNTDFVNLKKIKILITLNNSDYHAYRIAQVILPYAVDIDDTDGGYYFASPEIAQAAEIGERQLIEYLNTPGATELGFEEGLGSFKSWLKNLGKTVVKGAKAVGKAVVNTFVAPVKATVQTTKAGVNLIKAGVQAMTGNTAAAKSSLKEAVNNVKNSVVDPVKTHVSDTVNVFKTNVIDPTKFAYETTRDILKETIKIGTKVFKVLFLKINPLTVLTRNSLRALISINFLGLASRFNVGLLTEAQAAQLGYDKATWQEATKAIERLKKFYKKMGGNPSKILKSVTKGAGKKPLFKKDVSPSSKVNMATNDDEESALGMDPMVLSAIIGACSAFLSMMWQWVQKIVAKKEAEKQEAAQKAADEKAKAEHEELLKKYAHNNQGQLYVDEFGNYLTPEEFEAYLQRQQSGSGDDGGDDDKKKKIIICASVGVALLGGLLIIRSLTNKNK